MCFVEEGHHRLETCCAIRALKRRQFPLLPFLGQAGQETLADLGMGVGGGWVDVR